MLPDYQNGKPTIGVLAGWQFYRTATNLSYLAPVFRGIGRAAQDLGCNLLLGCGIGPSASPADPMRPAWPVQSAEADFVPIGPWNTDGIIIANPLHDSTRSRYVQELIAQGHPILFVGSGEAGPTIVADNRGGILEAMGHLVEHGHRQVAFIAGTVEDMNGDSGERLRAYQAALELYNLDKNPRLIVHGRHVYDGGYAAMREILAGGVPFTAVLASNDESALGAMQALKEAGRRVPGDVAVIGFDHRLEGAVHQPRLSSVHVPLLNIGYNALERMMAHITRGIELEKVVKVETRLIARDSCGCTPLINLPRQAEPGRTSQLAAALSERILSQAHSLTDEQCRSFCAQLVDTFSAALLHGQRAQFQQTLSEILQHTTAVDDDAHIWQEAFSVLGQQSWEAEFAAPLAQLLDEARLLVSAAMQRQHRQYVLDERWDSSRLSLLTARLLTALDETQIYEILARHLPDLDIHTARLVLFEPAEDDPCAWSVSRDALKVEQPPLRFPSREFPPPGMFASDQPFTLTLIPLVDPSGQLGFMAFGTEHFDLYGAVVQQVGGALNTAKLYRQATEGRRLAEEANRMKSRFLSTISHELRTPINLVVGLSGMVLRASDEGDAPLPETTQKDIERIHTYSQHLGGLIGDVIDLATSDAGQLRLNNAYVDLGQALRMVAESGRQLAADKSLVWEVVLPATGPWVWGDQTRLRQVALNLINNAIKFTSQGGVSLTLEENAGLVTVSVRDTGLGISPEEQQVIFDEFRQSERSIEKGYGGLGLGLAISKRLVEMHGGTIAVRSSGEEGAGSVFYITVPAVQPPAEQAQSLDKLPFAKQSVLVLTNRPDTSERLCEHLAQRGFKAQIALIKRGQAWSAQLVEARPDTIILDLSTDPALGWEALKEIKGSQGLAGIPVLFFSASQQEGSLLELDYLTKPIEISELTRALDQHWLLTGSTRPTHTILVVDDEPNTLEMHARIVQAHSASNRVLKARNGKEALEILHREMVDLILLDLQMPEMDGFEVLEVMRGMGDTRKIPVIVVTGKVLTEAEMARLNQGVAAVLGKGLFSIDETIAHISAALEHKRRLSSEAQRLVRLAMAFIHGHFDEALGRREIAQHVGIAEDHLTFCFRQELGTTPIEYLQRYRINQSKRLLKESQQTITEIALRVGFADSGYFSRIFRRETGMSPEAFRRS
jgi:signal transduction histidine kinase/DNA-binding LacI/PurR family transcriptional regulator/DNA-binding response OmpR family regulator